MLFSRSILPETNGGVEWEKYITGGQPTLNHAWEFVTVRGRRGGGKVQALKQNNLKGKKKAHKKIKPWGIPF